MHNLHILQCNVLVNAADLIGLALVNKHLQNELIYKNIIYQRHKLSFLNNTTMPMYDEFNFMILLKMLNIKTIFSKLFVERKI